MSYNEKLDLVHLKPIVRWWAVFAILGIVLFLTACKKDDNYPEDKPVEYPFLKVENQLTDSWRSITGISLVGYKFGSLNIEPHGGSQTFVLDKGMLGGYDNIYVNVGYIRYLGIGGSASITIDFHKGDTITIALKGCSGAEGCPGIYLEEIP